MKKFHNAILLNILFFSQIATALAPSVIIDAEKSLIFGDPNHVKTSNIAEQRYNYEMAKQAFSKQDWTSYHRYYALLGDYPLVPYLDYAELKRDIKSLPYNKIDFFISSQKGSFLAMKAREQVLYQLAAQENWPVYQAYYRPEVELQELQCLNLYARIQTGDPVAMDEVGKLWNSSKSIHSGCDRLFNHWRKQGGLSQEMVWQRFNKAMGAKKTGLARYIRGLMDTENKIYADKYFKVHGYPNKVKEKSLFDDINIKNQQIIVHGLKRLARNYPKSALHHWELYSAQQMFPSELKRDVETEIVRRLANKGYIEQAEWIVAQSNVLHQTAIVERLIREALRQQQWQKVVQWIDYLPQDAQQSDRWVYWRARAREAIINHPEHNPSEALYQSLADNRSFYGFLAADKLGHAYSIQYKATTIDPSTKIIVQNKPSIRRAKELWLRGSFSEAQAEWTFSVSKMSDEELKAAGLLANKWGWHNKAITAMIYGKHWDHLDVRFPLAYLKEINQASLETQVEVPLLYAIARQESAFKENALSTAGAMGLMQVMPSTAKQTAKKHSMQMTKQDLLTPEVNLSIGGHYLNELLEKYNGNRVLAAAAYNAGPTRVKRWTKNTKSLPMDIWIETIPFKETRGYVQNVLAFSVIYQKKLGKESQFLREIESADQL